MPTTIHKLRWNARFDTGPSVTPPILNALLQEAPVPVLVSFQN
jgi:hypothetical protein